MRKKTKKALRLGLALFCLSFGLGASLTVSWMSPGKLTQTAREAKQDASEAASKVSHLAQDGARDALREVQHIEIPPMPDLKNLDGKIDMPRLPPLPGVIGLNGKLPFENAYDTTPPTYEEPSREPPPTPRPTATAPPPRGDGARIAIVIDDMGGSPALSARAVALPDFVTLSYLPYVGHVEEQVAQAHNAGHEIMLHLPMEPKNGMSAGAGSLTSNLDDAEFDRRLTSFLDKFNDYGGVNNHMGSKLTAMRAPMERVMKALHERNLFFLDSRTSAQSVAFDIAEKMGLRAAARDVFLDDDPSPASIRAQLAHLEQVARRKGQAIAIGHPHPATVQALESWIPAARARGFTFVPVLELTGDAP